MTGVQTCALPICRVRRILFSSLRYWTYFASSLSVAEAIRARSGWKILLIGVSSDVVIMDRVTHSLYPAEVPNEPNDPPHFPKTWRRPFAVVTGCEVCLVEAVSGTGSLEPKSGYTLQKCTHFGRLFGYCRLKALSQNPMEIGIRRVSEGYPQSIMALRNRRATRDSGSSDTTVPTTATWLQSKSWQIFARCSPALKTSCLSLWPIREGITSDGNPIHLRTN